MAMHIPFDIEEILNKDHGNNGHKESIPSESQHGTIGMLTDSCEVPMVHIFLILNLN